MKICPGTKLTVTRAAIYETHGRAPSERQSVKVVKRVISCDENGWFVEIQGAPMRRFTIRQHSNGDVTMYANNKPPLKYYVDKIE